MKTKDVVRVDEKIVKTLKKLSFLVTDEINQIEDSIDFVGIENLSMENTKLCTEDIEGILDDLKTLFQKRN